MSWSGFSIVHARNLYKINRCFSSSPLLTIQRRSQKDLIDKSKVPVLQEEDLEETFIKGTGPGGSRINKTVSCVSLRHIPSGIILKCQFSRLLQENRKIARERLIEKLDNFYNEDMSVNAQKERLLLKKSIEASRKTQNLNELKRRYKEHLKSSASNPVDRNIAETVPTVKETLER